MRTAAEIAWAAGIIEGEGCLISGEYLGKRAVYKGKQYPIRNFRLAVEMTDLDVLQRLKHILGGHCTLRKRTPPSLNPKHRDTYILVLNGNELAGWLMTIYAYMGVRRRAKIREALGMWKRMRTNWRHVKQRFTSLRVE
jgi:hypothetical protein